MKIVSIDIEIPDGYEFVRVGRPSRNEYYMIFSGKLVFQQETDNSPAGDYIILTKRCMFSQIKPGEYFAFQVNSLYKYQKIKVLELSGKLTGFLYKEVDGLVVYFSDNDFSVIPLGDKE